MNQGLLDNAKRRALNMMDEWNDVSCVVPKNTGYYYEMQGIIEDAVEIGAIANSDNPDAEIVRPEGYVG